MKSLIAMSATALLSGCATSESVISRTERTKEIDAVTAATAQNLHDPGRASGADELLAARAAERKRAQESFEKDLRKYAPEKSK